MNDINRSRPFGIYFFLVLNKIKSEELDMAYYMQKGEKEEYNITAGTIW